MVRPEGKKDNIKGKSEIGLLQMALHPLLLSVLIIRGRSEIGQEQKGETQEDVCAYSSGCE
jgi:hypothetical protein